MKQYLNRIVRSIAHDVPKTVPRVPSISGIDLLVYGSRCPFAPVGSPCPAILPVSLADSLITSKGHSQSVHIL